MKAWEAHSILASKIGDPIECDTLSGIIPDGVRYSKKARSAYIDGGINNILSGIITKVQAMRADQRSDAIYGLFPTFTRNNTISFSNYVADTENIFSLPSSFDTSEIKAPVVIMDCSYVYVDGGNPSLVTREQVPVVGVNQYNQIVARRFKENFYADTIATYYGAGSGLRIYNSKNIDAGTVPDYIECNYLPEPKPLEMHLFDDDVDFEESYIATALYKASLLAMSDSGDINLQAMSQYIAPMLGNIDAGNSR